MNYWHFQIKDLIRNAKPQLTVKIYPKRKKFIRPKQI